MVTKDMSISQVFQMDMGTAQYFSEYRNALFGLSHGFGREH